MTVGGTDVTDTDAIERVFPDAELARLMMFGPLYRFSKHPADEAKYEFVDALYDAGFVIAKRDIGPE